MASTKLTERLWGVKTPPHIQDKCDFTPILLDGHDQLLDIQ